MGRRNRRGAELSGDLDPAGTTAAEQTPRPAARKPAQGFAPLDPFPAATEMFGAARLARLAWAFIALGVLVRSIRFLLDFPLWPDEAYLAHNYLDRGYLELLQALDYRQVAPLLYLWVQKTFVMICGFSEYSLRLYVFLGSLASLLLFRDLASRLLQGMTRLMAIALFAVAYPLIRYSAEAKPYGSDMLVSLVLLVLLVRWRGQREQTRWLWGLAIAMPLAVMLSYPAMFIVPVISLAMVIELFRSGSGRQWLAWLGVNVLVVGAAALLFFASARAQLAMAGPQMQKIWEPGFPPLHSAKQLALFLLDSHTGEAFAYPAGGARGASSLTTLFWLVGLGILIHGRRWWLLALFALPIVLNFTAAALHAYPYGVHPRFMLYMAPIFCLLAGLGGAATLSLIARSPIFRRPAGANQLKPGLRTAAVPAIVALAVLASIGGIASVRDFLKPYKETCWQRNRDFARWFWTDKSLGAELVCVSSDLKQPVSAAPGGDDLASVYFCNQRIYSRRLAQHQPPQLQQLSVEHPLRCARFRPSTVTDQDEARFQDWLRSMEAKYRLVGREKYPLTFFVQERTLKCVDQVEMYEFVPMEQPGTTQAASRSEEVQITR